MRRNPGDLMLGSGGRLVRPASESKELMGVIRKLEQVLAHARLTEDTHHSLDDAITTLKRLGWQASHGFHRNPPRPKFSAGNAVEKMSGDVHELRYVHADDGEPYRHEFNGDVEMWAIQRGDSRDILLTHKRGLPLWEDF